MKRISGFLIMCFVIMPFFDVAGKQVKAKKGEGVGKLRIICEEQGASFVIDEGKKGMKTGILPTEDIVLQAGEHTIKVWKTGFAPYAEVITVEQGEVLELEVELLPASARMIVRTSPVQGATVRLDGQVLGKTPLEVAVPVGERLVEIEMSGFTKEQRVVSFVPGKTETLDVTLSRLEVSEPKPSVPVYKKWWFWTTLGVVVTSVALPSVLLSKKLKDYPRADAVLEVR
jgi:hypothetical protein